MTPSAQLPTPTVVGPFNPLSGLSGSVGIGADKYAFGKWSLSMSANLIPVNNFTGGGYQQLVPGVKKAELTLDALTYDQGNMPFVVGQKYTFLLGYTATVNATISIYIGSIEPTVDYDGAQPIKITGMSDGPFNASIA
jgi:hypothetical protein